MTWLCAECNKEHDEKEMAWRCCANVLTVELYFCHLCGGELESSDALCDCLEPGDPDPEPDALDPDMGRAMEAAALDSLQGYARRQFDEWKRS